MQQVISVIANSNCKASSTCSVSLANTRAARSSNLGMDNSFAGATLDLDAKLDIASCGGSHMQVDHCCIGLTGCITKSMKATTDNSLLNSLEVAS